MIITLSTMSTLSCYTDRQVYRTWRRGTPCVEGTGLELNRGHYAIQMLRIQTQLRGYTKVARD